MVTRDIRRGVITYTYHAGGQLATEATPQWASSTLTLGYTSRLRTSLTLAQPVIGNWTHACTAGGARRRNSGGGGKWPRSARAANGKARIHGGRRRAGVQ